MRKIIVVLMFFVCASAYGQEIKKTRSDRRIERLMAKYPAYKVRDKEFKKWSKHRLNPKEALQIVLFVFVCASATEYVYTHDVLKRK